jgi:hypothetical protein
MTVGYLRNKIIVFWEKTPQIENKDTCTVDNKKQQILTEEMLSSVDLCTPGRANKTTALPPVKPNTFEMLLKYLRSDENFYRLPCSSGTQTTFCVILVTFLH